MLEGYIILVLTTLMLFWILAIGFRYYEHYLFEIFVNDATAKIASTYNNPSSDILMGYVNADSFADRDLYRLALDSELLEVNEGRAKGYLEYYIDLLSFGQMEIMDVDLQLVSDSFVRKHVELTVKVNAKSPFMNILSMMSSTEDATQWKAVSRADCTDIIDYFSTTEFVSRALNLNFLNDNKNLKNITSLIKTLVKCFNHRYAVN